MRRVVLAFLAIGLFAGCGCFPMAKYPPPDPPLVDEPAKTLDITTRVREPGVSCHDQTTEVQKQ